MVQVSTTYHFGGRKRSRNSSYSHTGPGEFNVDDWVLKKNKRTQGVNYIAYALCAAEQALESSGILNDRNFDADRTVRFPDENSIACTHINMNVSKYMRGYCM